MSVLFARGFKAGGVASGIKESGLLDLALVVCEVGEVPAAATFTRNEAVAAPVVLSREHLSLKQGRANGVIINSGNANALNGDSGMEAARAMARVAAQIAGFSEASYLVMSTGLIGIPFPIDRVLAAKDNLSEALGNEPIHALAAAQAMMTTDSYPKMAVYEGDGYRIGAMAKGAAMIAPNMATMLCVVTTDAVVEPDRLSEALSLSVSRTFNRITIDGCTSTNDTVAILASGAASRADNGFEEGLTSVLERLAYQIVADAEGGSKVGRIVVLGAADEEEADQVARSIANNLLVKCSLLGGDPYWGRVVAAAGTAGIGLDPSMVDVSYQGITVLESGRDITGHLSEEKKSELARLMTSSEIEIQLDLHRGNSSATMLTSDIGHGYLEENRGTS
jgi:glutamate N-acetyltransferase/amino-acid N-acetyltransferase